MEEQNSQPSWQTMAAMDIDRPQHPHLRISAAGKCPRAQAYAFMGKEETDPPGGHAQNRMNLGHMAELLIVKRMHEAGWETGHTVLSDSGQLELDLQIPDTDVTLRGHPDGICRHPQFTKGRWVTLECKSMSERMADQVEEHGIREVYPHYITQISIYGRILLGMGLVEFDTHGIFGLMDRDGRPMPPQRVPWESQEVDQDLNKLTRIVQTVQAGDLPERPYERSSRECQDCSYHTLCWGMIRNFKQRPRPVKAEDPEVIQAAEDWLKYKPLTDEARNILQEASDRVGQADILAGEVQAGYFDPREPRIYDPDLLEQYVPLDLLKRCLVKAEKKRPAYWVRKARK